MFPKHKRWQSQPKKKWPKKVNKSRRKMSNSITIYRNIRKYWDGNVVYPNIPKTTSLSLSLWDSGWSESFSASRRTCAFKVLACVFFTHFLSSNLCFQLICRILPVLSNLFTHFLSSIPPPPPQPNLNANPTTSANSIRCETCKFHLMMVEPHHSVPPLWLVLPEQEKTVIIIIYQLSQNANICIWKFSFHLKHTFCSRVLNVLRVHNPHS